jgi:hypothetical protein
LWSISSSSTTTSNRRRNEATIEPEPDVKCTTSTSKPLSQPRLLSTTLLSPSLPFPLAIPFLSIVLKEGTPAERIPFPPNMSSLELPVQLHNEASGVLALADDVLQVMQLNASGLRESQSSLTLSLG